MPLISWINITKTNDEVEHPEVAENISFIMENENFPDNFRQERKSSLHLFLDTVWVQFD